MKPGSVIALVILVFLIAGVTVWLVLRQTRETLAEAEKAAVAASDVIDNTKDAVEAGKKAWDSLWSWSQANA